MAATTTSSEENSSKFLPFNHFHPTEFLFKWITLEVFDEEILRTLRSDRRHRQTPQIEDYPCRVFLVDHEHDLRIRVWLKEQEAQVDTCSDYMYDTNDTNRMEPCWVCKWLDVDKNWMIDAEEVNNETTTPKPDFYRLHGDRYVQFGDGGSAFLAYPVWIHEQLPVSDSRRQRLTNTLYELNEKRQDHHPSPSPVEDIIDPDLLPYKPSPVFNRDRWIERRLKQLKKSDRVLRNFKRDLSRGDYNDLSEHEQIRNCYQWVPSEFVIDKDGKVDIVTPIHHLPVLTEYKHAYGDIARIFHAMLPMFEKLKLIKLNNIQEQQRLQVIVKAQSYNLKAGMKYSGRWHTEGHTENIIAVGVYYLHVDDQLEGGALKFRPRYAPQDYYDGIQTDHCISSVQTGAAIVFSNSIPHRFQQIRNLTSDDGRRRTFLNFFIVDPNEPIPVSSNSIICAPKDVIVDTLQKWNAGRLPVVVRDEIYRLLKISSAWENENEAKEFRRHVRRAMMDEKSGWGWICWGNCGTTEFVRALCTWPPREREEVRGPLNHTESE
ncbi:unnamed protein product [Adineta ricciae]|uniref:DUF4246 domain-containing protein n=1 Tax=Adineta ricciae TaxID=249248 RepID=A0A814BSE9_ADIRI|nr:unnamed protein product [Adineta ricciae]CAF0933376.1 unnamed protein product [Adineta ricciae]